MNPYSSFIEAVEEAVCSARKIPCGGIQFCKSGGSSGGGTALLFSPHPDDECITGLLPLRLMREAGIKIINVPVTFGSNDERQPGRAGELRNACGFLGWEVCGRNSFKSLEKAGVVEIFKTVQPDVIFVPHSKDWNSRHISTHFLVMDALPEMGKDFSCAVIETEYWRAMEEPNLMIEADVATLADLVAALSFHEKEVERNPYHLSLPAWMQDNVRRGGELVGGQGCAAPNFTFATLYRLCRWENGACRDALERGRFVSMNDNLKELLKWK